MSDGVKILIWVVVAAILLGCLAFVAILAKFLYRASSDYIVHKPYSAVAAFAIPGSVTSFAVALLGLAMPISVLAGAVVGTAVFLLIAVEFGSG